MEKVKGKKWGCQHIAFQLKWVFGGVIEIIATAAHLLFKTATFGDWLTAQSIIVAIVGADMAMKLTKIKNGGKSV